MSDIPGPEGMAGFTGQTAAGDAPTAGALLRRAREAAGLHVAALAVSLKVPVRKLEALEDDRWDVLSDAVFVRALASTVCRTLKIDPQPVLDRLPQSGAPRLIETGAGLNAPFRAPGDGTGPGWVDQLSKPVFLAAFALLLGALVLILLPSMQRGDTVEAAAGPGASPSQPAAVAASTAALAEPGPMASPVSFAQPVAAAATTPAAVPAAGASTADVSAAAPAAGATETVETADGAASAPAAPASGILVFRASSPSWVEVTDARGVVAVRRLLAAGEAAGASGALPLQVVVGRVDATEVQLRGKPFDLRPVSRDNVARFEVK